MASTLRKRGLVALMTKLARRELGEDATALDWACDRLARGHTFVKMANELGRHFGENWSGQEGSGPWTPSRWFVNATCLRLSADARRRLDEARTRGGAPALKEDAMRIVDEASTESRAHAPPDVELVPADDDTRATPAGAEK
jgi:hypothetical protein